MGFPAATASKKTKIWTRDEIVSRILAGETLVIFSNTLLRIPPSWLDAHPGGSLAILHFVGRDATDEILAYHCDETLTRLKMYAVGTVEVGKDGWEPLVPPIMNGWVRKNKEWVNEAAALISEEDTEISPSSQILLVDKNSPLLKRDNKTVYSTAPTLATLTAPPTNLSLKTQYSHSAAYKKLHDRITSAGLYRTRYITGYGPEILRYTLLASISAYAYMRDWQITSALFLGLLWHQLVFSVHDLGHMGVTHNWAVDRVLAILLADFIGGLSIGWWVENHNVHHLVTNHPSHDPDIAHLPFFAISPAFFKSLYSSFYKRIMHFDAAAKVFISIQHKLFYIILLFGRFNLYVNSYSYLFRKVWDTKRARGGRWAWWLEFAGIVFFWMWFGGVLYGCGTWGKAVKYLLVSHLVTSPVHLQIVLSHFSMSTADLGPTESFPHRQLRTTTDVICPSSISFIHGGLQLQVTHHLFPRLPRHNLKEASALVKEFAKEQGLVYAEFGFVEGNEEVVGVLRGVAEQVKLVGMVANGEAREMAEKMNRKVKQS